MTDASGHEPFSSRRRRELFLNLAGRAEGATVAETYVHAQQLGDTATEEAYHNIARRLMHRSAVAVASVDDGRTRYVRVGTVEEHWLEEDELAELVDPDYPIVALAIWRESRHQISEVPEGVWVELRERLAGTNARALFVSAIQSYAEDFHSQISDLARTDTATADPIELARMRQHASDAHRLLLRFTKYGLGLSYEAVALPPSVDQAISEFRETALASYVDVALLTAEIARRVEDGPFVQVARPGVGPLPLVGGVDGSTRGGLLSGVGEYGDFNVTHSPLVSINTAVGTINRNVRSGTREYTAFIRLPERPEDMQRRDNRHTVMAKLLHPDMSDAEYMHAVWNAMDLIEVRATLRLLKRWYADPHSVEVPPAEVVLRDGTVTPQDRDFTHYKAQTTYGQIVRDLIEANWEVARTASEDGRVVCGVVKQSQLGFFGPVLNWFACQAAAAGSGQLTAWPLATMNLVPDQVLITRLLTAERGKGDAPTRTAIVLRPFHAVTNYARNYRRRQSPADRVIADLDRIIGDEGSADQDEQLFWKNFQRERDPYIKMLRRVHYASLFVAAVPRLDSENMLPRLEVLIVNPTHESGPSPWASASPSIDKAVAVVVDMGFEVAAEHSMFRATPKLDILPKLLVKAHETVKTWAQELVGRVQEYVGYHLASYAQGKRARGVQVRPFSRSELEALYQQLRSERELQAGAQRLEP